MNAKCVGMNSNEINPFLQQREETGSFVIDLFDAFYSADKARNKSTSGFGLGLAIVKQIVELQDGCVSVSHSPLGGACFTVCFQK